MKTVKLKDLVDFSNGYAFKSTDYVEYSNTVNCRMSNIRPDGSFDVEYNIKYLPDEFAEKYKGFILNDGDIIIAMTDMAGDPKILGVPTLVNTKGYSVLMNQRVGKLTLKSKDIHPTYLKYYLMSNYARNYFKSFAGGGVQLNIGQKEILNIDIKLCDIKEQVEICNVLDKINVLIQQNSKQIEKLDQLIKSRFIELFGDPVSNPNNYLVKTLQELIDMGYITYHLDGNHGGDYPRSDEFVEFGVPYIGANCIVNGEIDLSMAKYLTVERANKLRKGIAQNEDVLFAHNATVGPTVVLHTTEPKIILSTSLTAYRCNKEKVSPYYLKLFMQSDGFVRQYASEMKQTTRNQVPITVQKKYSFLIPPIDLQNQFAEFVEQTDKSKLALQQSLEKLETLKKSLMQKYFG